jgi:hypothetical protein
VNLTRIDYYDASIEFGSEVPADPSKTTSNINDHARGRLAGYRGTAERKGNPHEENLPGNLSAKEWRELAADAFLLGMHDAELQKPRRDRWAIQIRTLPASGFDCRRPAGQSIFAGCVIGRDGRTVMAKGQKRSNREAKKPKADKKKMIASADTAPSALAKPKPGAAKAETKR